MRALAPEVLFQVRKTLDEGHGFSRAVNRSKQNRLLAAEVRFSMWLRWDIDKFVTLTVSETYLRG